MSAITSGATIPYTEKEPFTHGAGNLMVVVGMNNDGVLVIAGTDIEDIKWTSFPDASQAHAPVFSADGRCYHVMGSSGCRAKVDQLAREFVAGQT